ncbi:hypothetical protein QRX50_36140 [Amycolatopsis carbonis]|uniref:Uncharacterized protein n=1 Tax=Amycolatopsis carbonis TaxID=715471 RepID=A0A9Y2MTG2_9PSEU|nr:hypothetical protein [Amycolatopsis sp. 2-15]WIX76823.1 hypothetical protein QRX50_36140 [Amycolatopsis sp. 2-15]
MTTGDNKQEMFRWHPREQFPITTERLRQGIAELEDMVHELYKHRHRFRTSHQAERSHNPTPTIKWKPFG